MESQVLHHNSLNELPTLLPSLLTERNDISSRLLHAQVYLFFVTPLSFLLPNLKAEKVREVTELKRKLEDLVVEVIFPHTTHDAWEKLAASYFQLLKSRRSWRLLRTTQVDRAEERTPALLGRVRKQVSFEHKSIPFIKSDQQSLFFPVKHYQLYLYPSFYVLLDNNAISVGSLSDVTISCEEVEYIEDEPLPKDAKIIRYTWKKANLDGSPDKRFSGNVQIPILRYIMITLLIQNTHGRYLFSDAKAGEEFVALFTKFCE